MGSRTNFLWRTHHGHHLHHIFPYTDAAGLLSDGSLSGHSTISGPGPGSGSESESELRIGRTDQTHQLRSDARRCCICPEGAYLTSPLSSKLMKVIRLCYSRYPPTDTLIHRRTTYRLINVLKYQPLDPPTDIPTYRPTCLV